MMSINNTKKNYKQRERENIHENLATKKVLYNSESCKQKSSPRKEKTHKIVSLSNGYSKAEWQAVTSSIKRYYL